MLLNYKSYGKGEPLIILHGLFGSLDNWHSVASKLAEYFNVITIDQRNHGKSFHSDEFNYEVMANDLKKFIDQKNFKNIFLAGHSMGGKTAMKFTFKFPDCVKKLIVVDIAPKKYPGGHDEILEALCSFPIKKIKSRSEADKVLSEKISDFGVRQFLLKNIERTKENSYKWKMNLPVIKKNYDAVTEEISSEQAFNQAVLFIRGGRSAYIKDEDMIDIKKLFPSVQLETIKNSGHWVHAEAKDEFIEVVKKFLL